MSIDYEYMVRNYSNYDTLEGFLNDRLNSGWEFVAYSTSSQGNFERTHSIIIRRPKP